MKFSLGSEPELQPLRRHLTLEGHEVGGEGYYIGRRNGRSRGCFGGETVAEASLSALGIEVGIDPHPRSSFISRWFEEEKWGKNVFHGEPLVGVMEGGRGAKVAVGCRGHYVTSEATKSEFERPELCALLGELKHSGWVTLWKGSKGSLECLETGVPSWGLYNILEGVPKGIGGFFSDPLGTELKESWTMAVVVSRWPFPGVEKTKERVTVGGITPMVEKHFWLGEHEEFRGTFSTHSTLLGVATAWGRSREWAEWQVERTCRAVEVGEVQWRVR